jgi:uncharacterized protein (TIGR00369 family)
VADAGESLSERAEFYQTLGLRVVTALDGVATVDMPDATGFRNSRGDIHGGAVLSLADVAASNAVRSRLGPGDGLATLSVTMNFARPARAPAQAVGQVVSVGGRTAFAQVDVWSGGEIVANGVATIRLFRAATGDRG